jgi:predicted ATPase/DNA-binding CsgD family transcriptional regulator
MTTNQPTNPAPTGVRQLATRRALRSLVRRPRWFLTNLRQGPEFLRERRMDTGVEAFGSHVKPEAEAVARTLGARPGADRSPVEVLVDHLAGRGALLVLDNCEHVVERCAGLVDVLLRCCPHLKILATSREPLGVAGEIAWPVPSLSLPEPGRGDEADDLLRFGAIRLFVERAASAAPGFALTEQNAGPVTRICARLDGIPLAIELAASRVRVLSPAQIAARLDDRFLLLTEGGRVAVPRQRTLRATMDWGHGLLSEKEKVLFRRLSVFADGFSLPAAEAICPKDGIEAGEVLELLSCLVDKSLVVAHGGRYRMLETVLRYAAERLEDAGEESDLREAHARYFLDLADEAEPGLLGGEQVSWLGRLDRERGNLRSALDWCVRHRNPAALRMAGALWWYWFLRGRYKEGLGWFESSLAACSDAPASLRAKALVATGDFLFLRSEYGPGRRRIEAGLDLYRRAGDGRGVAGAVQLLGSIAREQGRYDEAEAHHAESLGLSREHDDGWGVAQSLNYLGFVAWLRGEPERAVGLCAEALSAFRDLGDGEGAAWSLMNLGFSALYRGEPARARALLSESLDLSRTGGYREAVAWSLNGLGLLARREGDPGRAASLLRESLALHRDLGDRWRTASLVEELAGVSAAGGHHERAATLLGAAGALRETLSDPVPPCERPDRARDTAVARAGLDEGSFVRASAAGGAMPLERVYELALEEQRSPAPTFSGSGDGLSEREAEVLGMVAEGLTDGQVAAKLYLSPRTVGQHLRNTYRKLGVNSRAAATRVAIERGLI